MDATLETIEISGSSFFDSADTLASYQGKTRQLLEKLQAIHPYFETWFAFDKERLLPLQRDFSDLDERIHSVVSSTKVSDLVFGREETKIGPATMNRIGFAEKYFAHPTGRNASNIIDDRESIELSVHGNSAGAEPHGGIILIIPVAVASGVFSIQDFREIVCALASVCKLTVMSVGTATFEAAIRQDGDVYSGQWMTYYRMPHLQHCLPRELHSTQLGDGTLIETTPSFPDANNPADVAAGKRVREALDHLGLVWHSTYAIHGWPPDEEEWRYEEFISGAPRGRKYRVRCIDFDGYDAQRDVLLYAKLFRRLRQQRKEWGLRGWDGPVLNEARRQVRAANGTQIEWHVGLEEPASRVRTLLADYTDFNDAQLRVIYTPLSTTLSP